MLSPEYEAEMLGLPTADGVNVTEHAAVPAVVAARVHGLPVNEPEPPVWLNVTVPVGVVGDVEMSVTVAVQVVGVLTVTVDGWHATEVVVVLSGTGVTMTVVWLKLVACVASPL